MDLKLLNSVVLKNADTLSSTSNNLLKVCRKCAWNSDKINLNGYDICSNITLNMNINSFQWLGECGAFYNLFYD